MTMEILHVDRRRYHQCSVCKRFGPWGKAWRWYGSWKEVDDGKPIVKACSRKCSDKARELRLVPLDANYDDAADVA